MDLQYKSFYWCLGTTSFRTKNFNKKIEQQLALLRDFWTFEKKSRQEWNGNNELQTAYYDFLHQSGFLYGNANNKPKDAREKTSGLVSLGLIDDGRKLTAVGNELLKLSEQNDFHVDNNLGIHIDNFFFVCKLYLIRQRNRNRVSRFENVRLPQKCYSASDIGNVPG